MRNTFITAMIMIDFGIACYLIVHSSSGSPRAMPQYLLTPKRGGGDHPKEPGLILRSQDSF